MTITTRQRMNSLIARAWQPRSEPAAGCDLAYHCVTDDVSLSRRRQKAKEDGNGPSDGHVVPKAAAVVETLESLQAKLASVTTEVTALTELIAAQASVLTASTVNDAVPAAVDDELEAFMQANDVTATVDSVQALKSELATLQHEQARLQRLVQLAQPALPGLKPKAKPDDGMGPGSPKSPAAPASATAPPDDVTKKLTGIDKKQAYWKEKMKAAKAAARGMIVSGDDKPTAAPTPAPVTADELIAAAAPQRAGLGSGQFKDQAMPSSTAAVTAAAKYAVNRLPSATEVESVYKPGLNAMK